MHYLITEITEIYDEFLTHLAFSSRAPYLLSVRKLRLRHLSKHLFQAPWQLEGSNVKPHTCSNDGLPHIGGDGIQSPGAQSQQQKQ